MWLYNNKEIHNIEDLPKCFGFVYKITNLNTKEYYIGKKQLISVTHKKLTKKEISELPVSKGRKPTTREIVQESNWKSYWSSSTVLKKHVKETGESSFKREILVLARDKRELTFLEVEQQILNNVLRDPLSINDTILGKFFKIQNLDS